MSDYYDHHSVLPLAAGEDPAVLTAALRGLVAENRTDRARHLFERFRHQCPDNYSLTLPYIDILIRAGQLTEAATLIEEELDSGGESYALLARLGLLDEKAGLSLNAFDLYRRAAALAGNESEKKEAYRLQERARRGLVFRLEQNSACLTIKLEGNGPPLDLSYDLDELTEQGALCRALDRHIHPGAATVLQVECRSGVPARYLLARGYAVQATASGATDLLAPVTWDYLELMRGSVTRTPAYYQATPGEVAAGGCGEADVICYLPREEHLPPRAPAARLVDLLAGLLQQSREQLFYYHPPGPGGSPPRQEAASVAAALQARTGPGWHVEACPAPGLRGLLYQVRRPGWTPAPAPSPGPPRPGDRGTLYRVNLENCRTPGGFGLGKEGWSPYSAQLRRPAPDKPGPAVSYAGSALHHFYEHFQPQNRAEELFGPGATGPAPLERGWTILPWEEKRGQHTNPLRPPASARGADAAAGPLAADLGLLNLEKLLATAANLKKLGYRSESFPDGYMRGYFLRQCSAYRFIVTRGRRRAAACAVLLNRETVPVRLDPAWPAVVDREDLGRWPQVTSGLYRPAAAAAVFDSYFQDDGRMKARQAGLL